MLAVFGSRYTLPNPPHPRLQQNLQEDSALRVETAGGKISLEATFDQQAGEIRGVMQVGRSDVPIVLRKGTSK